MIITLRTDTATCEVSLYKHDKQQIDSKVWEAGRQLALQLPGAIEDLLEGSNFSWNSIKGIIIFRGPGSFTGLRIGSTVANTIAYSLDVPIIGTSGENWIAEGMKRLNSGKDDRIVLPEYGSPVRTTKPRK